MNVTKYRDLNILTGWIDNQKAFEKHKKMLDEIYKKLNKRSADEFGINHSKSFEHLQLKVKNIAEYNKFSQKGKNFNYYEEKGFTIDKDNERLKQKINNIQNRKNYLLDLQEIFIEKNTNLKRRTDLLKNIEQEKLRKENESLGMRIISK
jgi:hypothetical protein